MRNVLAAICVLAIGRSAQANHLLHRMQQLPHNHDSVYVYGRQLLSHNPPFDEHVRAQANLLLSGFYFDAGAIDRALMHALQAEELFIETHDEAGIARAVAFHGYLLHYTGEFARSGEELHRALELWQRLGGSRGLADVLGKLGHHYEKQGNYSRALALQQEALELFQQLNDSLGMSVIHENIGSIYEDQNRFAQALAAFQSALALLPTHAPPTNRCHILNNIGDAYRKSNRPETGLEFSRQSAQLAAENNLHYQLRSAYRDMAKCYTQLGNWTTAYSYLDQSYQAYEDLFNSEVARQLTRSEVMFEVQRKETELALKDSEIHLLEQDRHHQAVQKKFLSAGLLLALMAAGLIVFLTRQKLRTNKRLAEQKARIYEAQNELQQSRVRNLQLKEAKLRSDLENQLLREKLLEEELETKSKELASQTLTIMRSNKLLHNLKSDLSSTEVLEKPRKLVRNIEQHIRSEHNWENFQQLFEGVHHEFFERLTRHCADLSPAELRLCCLIKLNVPGKDIASMLAISPDSLRIARYRLRKRLGLETGENLNKFILSL